MAVLQLRKLYSNYFAGIVVLKLWSALGLLYFASVVFVEYPAVSCYSTFFG